jgi:hypothetical protein
MYRVMYVSECQKKRKLQKEISELKCRRVPRRLITTSLTAHQCTLIVSSGGDNENDGQDIFTRAYVGSVLRPDIAVVMTTMTMKTTDRDMRHPLSIVTVVVTAAAMMEIREHKTTTTMHQCPVATRK